MASTKEIIKIFDTNQYRLEQKWIYSKYSWKQKNYAPLEKMKLAKNLKMFRILFKIIKLPNFNIMSAKLIAFLVAQQNEFQQRRQIYCGLYRLINKLFKPDKCEDCPRKSFITTDTHYA